MVRILPHPSRDDQRTPVVNPHQPPGWQRTQNAAIIALAAAEDHLAGIGIPRAQARVYTRAAIRTFLQNMAMSSTPLSSCSRTHETVEDYLKVCEFANRGGHLTGDQAS